MKPPLLRGQTSNIAVVFIPDTTSTTGAGKTGLTNASAGLIIGCRREKSSTVTAYSGANIVSITTLGTYAAPGAGKIGFKEIDATNQPGMYELQFDDALLGTSDTSRMITGMVQVTGGAPSPFEVALWSIDPQDGVRAAMTSLPNATAGASGGLPVLDASLRVLANLGAILGTALTETAGQTAAAFKQFFNVATPTGTVNSLPNAVPGATGGLLIAGSNAATTVNITGNLTGNVSGSVGSVTGAVGSVTGNVGGNVVGSVGSVTAAVTLSAGDSPVMQSGTAAAGGASTITIATALGADNLPVGCIIKITSGTGADQARVITGYVNATKVATVDRAWTTAPDATSVYSILYADLAATNASLQVVASSVQGNVTGSVGSVTGAVGSVTGNVGGNVVGSVGSVMGAVGSVTSAVSVSGFSAGAITATAIAAGALDGKGDWLLASNYATPPTVAQIATQIFTDLLAGTDFATAGSFGALVKANLDTNVGSRSTYAGADTPGTTTLLSRLGGPITLTAGAVTVGANNDKTGYALSATGLDQIAVTDPGGVANMTTLPKMMVAVWRYLYKKVTMTASQEVVYADNGTTANATMATSDDGTTQTKGAAT